MKYISVAEAAKKWGVSERSVRGYCAEGKIDGAFLTGKTWNIPETAEKPDRINKKTDAPKTLLEVLKAEKAAKLHGGIYHKIQIDLTYNSNHIEDDIKMFYYRGLKEWRNEHGYLRDTCLSAQDSFKKYLDYFRVPYDQ